ncbi:MAG: hypothetical protein E7604_07365 [Ruminococcaceae bacterium]|nr:hypothetical protein [Oscillospiraceae bacterium]
MNYAESYYLNQIDKKQYEEYLSPEAVKQVYGQFWTTVLFHVSSDTADSRIKAIYKILVDQISSLDPISWLDEPEVFLSTAAVGNGRKRIPWCGIAGLILLAALIVRFVLAKTTADLITAILIGVGLLAFLVQTVLLWVSASTKPQQKFLTKQRVSSVKFKAGLQSLAKMLDGHADTLYQVMNEASVTAGGTEDTDVSLLLDLMKLPSIEQNQDAMDVIDRYLIQHGITRVDYSAAQADLFDVMPADQTKTILPVLIRDGVVLNRGYACTKMEGM